MSVICKGSSAPGDWANTPPDSIFPDTRVFDQQGHIGNILSLAANAKNRPKQTAFRRSLSSWCWDVEPALSAP
jgi:hypothetical protein